MNFTTSEETEDPRRYSHSGIDSHRDRAEVAPDAEPSTIRGNPATQSLGDDGIITANQRSDGLTRGIPGTRLRHTDRHEPRQGSGYQHQNRQGHGRLSSHGARFASPIHADLRKEASR
jgi:hypothetical protein